MHGKPLDTLSFDNTRSVVEWQDMRLSRVYRASGLGHRDSGLGFSGLQLPSEASQHTADVIDQLEGRTNGGILHVAEAPSDFEPSENLHQ
jgi:hypothetical protein